jgi:hypothetical protein
VSIPVRVGVCDRLFDGAVERIESQIRPLMKLDRAAVDEVWKPVLELSAGRRISGRLVGRSVRDAGPAAKPKEQKKLTRQQRVEHHKGIGDAIGQLLVLISQRTRHEMLMEQVQTLNHHFQGLLSLEKTHKRQLRPN